MAINRILAIDPGTTQSAFAMLDNDLRPVEFGIMENGVLLDVICARPMDTTDFVIEMVESYGMPVGKEVFETVVWIGRFMQAAIEKGSRNVERVSRKEVKLNLCNSAKAKDSNIRQALLDRFGTQGTKKAPGWFYGVSKDVWAAIAVGVTYADKLPFDDFHEPTGAEIEDLFREPVD